MFLTFFFTPLCHKKTIFSQKKFFLRSALAREVAREVSHQLLKVALTSTITSQLLRRRMPAMDTPQRLHLSALN
jgi:hypothetical protein